MSRLWHTAQPVSRGPSSAPPGGRPRTHGGNAEEPWYLRYPPRMTQPSWPRANRMARVLTSALLTGKVTGEAVHHRTGGAHGPHPNGTRPSTRPPRLLAFLPRRRGQCLRALFIALTPRRTAVRCARESSARRWAGRRRQRRPHPPRARRRCPQAATPSASEAIAPRSGERPHTQANAPTNPNRSPVPDLSTRLACPSSTTMRHRSSTFWLVCRSQLLLSQQFGWARAMRWPARPWTWSRPPPRIARRRRRTGPINGLRSPVPNLRARNDVPLARTGPGRRRPGPVSRLTTRPGCEPPRPWDRAGSSVHPWRASCRPPGVNATEAVASSRGSATRCCPWCWGCRPPGTVGPASRPPARSSP